MATLNDNPGGGATPTPPPRPVPRPPQSDPTVGRGSGSLASESKLGESVPGSWSAPIGQDERVGAYTLVRALGEGGFGVVYEANRREPFVQSVAIKVLKPGMDSGEVLNRFEQERQALALMDHPGVAKVLDGGMTDAASRFGAGRPYFVMELVSGEAITRFCAERSLGLKDRLGLFMKVCDAVQHAHQKGIIHRDIKPTNILVSMVDGVATPKVIDFGIAKALGGSITGRTLFTERGHMIGTPEYMSPEQADALPDVDTRSDVYSLGVLLYELLTGELPFSSQELRRAGFAEILRIIREVDPPTPSTRVAQKTQTRQRDRRAGESRDDSGPAPTGQRELRGDLDWIVMRSLNKARERRYESPGSLSADILRYLRSEPVEAGPPSAMYRLSKFTRRHRALVAGSVVAIVALLAGLGLALIGLREARIERDAAIIARAGETQEKEAAQAARDQERREKLRAESALKLVRDSIDGADPFREQSSLSFADLLESMSATLDREPPADKEQEIAARVLIGECFGALGQGARGAAQLERARTMMPDDSITSASRSSGIMLAEIYASMSRPKDALLILDQIQPTLELPGDVASTRALYQVMLTRGEALRRMQDRAGAEQALRRAMTLGEELCATSGTSDCLDVARACNRLAVLLSDQRGRQDEALVLARRALKIAESLTGPESAWSENFQFNIGIVQRERGELHAAVDAYTKAYEIGQKRDVRPNIRTTGPRRLHAIAIALRDMNKLGEAREIQMLSDPKLSSESALSRALTGLAGALLAEKKFAEASDAADRALAIRMKIMPAGDWRIFSTMSTLGAAKAGMGDIDAARKILKEAAEGIWEMPTIPAKRKRPILERFVEVLSQTGPAEETRAWADRLRTMESSGSVP